MSVPNKQIGWSQESNLLWQVAKQLEGISCQVCNIGAVYGTSGTSGTSGYDGDRYLTNSTSTFELGVSTSLYVEPGLAYSVAQDILISYDIDNHQVCSVVSYDINTGLLVIGPPVTVTGSGTYSSWLVNLDGAAGGNGTSGTSGTSGINGTSGSSGSSITSYYGSFIFDSDTTLSVEIPNPSSTANIEVASTTGFNAPGYMRIGNEIIGYTGKTPTTFTGITRGVATSTATSHIVGSFISQAQATAASTPTQVLLDQTNLSNGVVLSGLGNVTVLNAGVYNIQFSIQIQNYGNDYEDTAVWFRKNGNDIPQSTSYTTSSQLHAQTPGATVLTVNIFEVLAANDVLSLGWFSVGGTTAITSVVPAGNLLPVSPGVIFTVNRIG